MKGKRLAKMPKVKTVTYSVLIKTTHCHVLLFNIVLSIQGKCRSIGKEN